MTWDFEGKNFTGVVLGVLVVEDLVAVVLMVLLSTLAVSQQVEGMEMLKSILKLGAFSYILVITRNLSYSKFSKKGQTVS